MPHMATLQLIVGEGEQERKVPACSCDVWAYKIRMPLLLVNKFRPTPHALILPIAANMDIKNKSPLRRDIK